MVKGVLAGDEVQARGWLLDGYPRSGEQADAIEAEGIRPDVFLLIQVGKCVEFTGEIPEMWGEILEI